ncbi:MarR family winged helix-turn-helix transcriptional regulator [Nocardia stercoris]|uniref:MarR family transcriptional regulator n=1 Tax=Nocardia stercoris TaxID=2483361 RepID=A0A3M2L8E8_9NOCA|nr:MarR family transcriptional regulator [Nocardia stercoris]RMI33674.1 MarR family transcriptional regulator [Nocardia stercoris]
MQEDYPVLSFLVRRVWLGMRATIGEELARFQLTVPQFATLIILADHPDVSVSDVARHVGSSRQAANEMLAGLERQDLIVRSPHPVDRRKHVLEITAQGRKRLAEARPAVERRERELEAEIAPEHRAAVRKWLVQLAASCVADPFDPRS